MPPKQKKPKKLKKSVTTIPLVSVVPDDSPEAGRETDYARNRYMFFHTLILIGIIMSLIMMCP